jgi:hypothetical protein
MPEEGCGEICALLGHYAALNGDPILTFRDNVSVPSSRVKKSKMAVTTVVLGARYLESGFRGILQYI